MKRSTILGAVTALALAAATAAPQPGLAQTAAAPQTSGNAAAAITALLLIGAGVAIAKHGKDDKSHDKWDDQTHGKPFSPAKGIVCMPRQKKCFRDGHLSHRWSERIFG